MSKPISKTIWDVIEVDDNDVIHIDYDAMHFKDSHLLSPAANHFNEYGYYCPYNKDINYPKWKEFWKEEKDRCLNGYTAENGVEITGYHYFYLNYCPIDRAVDVEMEDGTTISKRKNDFPLFYDGDWLYFWLAELARKWDKHLNMLKARRKGYSYKNAGMMARNYHLIRRSKNFALAGHSDYLEDSDALLPKVWNFVSHNDEHCAWAQPRLVNKWEYKISGYKKKINGQEVDKGFQSKVEGKSLNNNPDGVRGAAGELVLWEESGKFPELLDAWEIAMPLVKQGAKTLGLMIAFGTGGTEGADFASAEALFEKPEVYDCLAFNNIWDEGARGTTCGFFHPNRLTLDGFIDEDGNSDMQGAYEYEQKQRELKKKGDSGKSYEQYVAEHAECLEGNTWVSFNGKMDKISNFEERMENGVRDLYKVTTSNNRELICTKNHLIYDGEGYKPLKKFEEEDSIEILPIEFNNEYQQVKINNRVSCLENSIEIDEEWAKFIGIFMADGSIYKERVSIAFDKRDKESIDWVEKFMNKNLSTPYEKDESMGEGGCNVSCHSKHYSHLFKELGLAELRDKKHLKRKVCVPDYIMKSPKSVVASFLSGYFDGDGSISKSGTISFYCKHNNFIQRVLILLSGFEIFPKYSIKDRTKRNNYSYKERKVSLRKEHNEIFRDEIRFISERKNERLDNYENKRSINRDYSKEKISNVEFYKRDEVYNIETDKGYYSANGIWTHNSPQEATIQSEANLFPTKDLQEQLNKVKANNKHHALTPGYLVDKGEEGIKFSPSNEVKPIFKYPHSRKDDLTGGILIKEDPHKNKNGDIPRGLYILCHDPYAHDSSTDSESLGAAYVIKRTNNFSPTYNECIVASYVGRPDTQDEYNKNMFRLAEYYNAKIGFENDRGDVIGYAKRHQKLGFLEEEFEMLYKKELSSSRVNRNYGMHMTQQRIDQGEVYLRDWLNTVVMKTADGKDKKVLHTIYDPALLKELIKYNKKGNFDRVRALMVGMYHNKELYNQSVAPSNEGPQNDDFFNRQYPG